jgi:AAA+ lid domain
VLCRKLTRSIRLDPSVELAAIARTTEGFSGADLKALLYTAQLGMRNISKKSFVPVVEFQIEYICPEIVPFQGYPKSWDFNFVSFFLSPKKQEFLLF